MGQKKRRHPDVEDILARPWCYYCERDFEDLKLLISHQKAKHFKCDRCSRRLNTAGGLSVHLNQVHKETLNQVENALPNRQGLDVEIFGMEGIPQEILEQHRNRIIQNYYQAQEDRRLATGNPVPGGNQKARKKVKLETAEELKARLAEHRLKLAAQKSAAANGAAGNVAPSSAAGAFSQPFQAPPGQYPDQQPGYPPPGAPQQQHFFPPPTLPARPTGILPTPTNLPQRPPLAGAIWSGPGAPPPGYVSNMSGIDGLATSTAHQGDDIDQLIRMAEAGIKPPKKQEIVGESTEPASEKKSKKEKARMVYADMDVSPEERMANLPRYSFIPARG